METYSSYGTWASFAPATKAIWCTTGYKDAVGNVGKESLSSKKESNFRMGNRQIFAVFELKSLKKSAASKVKREETFGVRHGTVPLAP